jgi:hypothetical protein
MQPKLTREEYDELHRLLNIVRDKTNLPGERRMAMAKFDLIYANACRRTGYEVGRYQNSN